MISQHCLNSASKSLNVQMHLITQTWAIATMGVFLHTSALRSFSVEHVLATFYENLLQLKSGQYSEFWKELLGDFKHQMKGSNEVLASMIFCILGLYIAVNFSDQRFDILTDGCNFTNLTSNYIFSQKIFLHPSQYASVITWILRF